MKSNKLGQIVLTANKNEPQLPKCMEGREYYRPFDYPRMFELAQEHERIHWVPTEVALSDDVYDWNNVLTTEEKDLLTNLFRFFTQADVGVLQGYAGHFLPFFYKTPELAAVFSSIAARECVHVWGYSLLLDTLDLPESEYSKFLEYDEMVEKNEYVDSFNMETPETVAKTLAVYGAFVEGIQLFSTFAILMNFTRFKKMRGMGKIVEWSIRDEDKHVEACVQMFKIWMEENPQIDSNQIKKDVTEICKHMVELEDNFIDFSFKEYTIDGIDKEDLKVYIRSLADFRLQQLGFDKVYNVGQSELASWLEPMIYGSKHTNFFDNRVTDYEKGSMEDDMDAMEDWGV